MNQYRGKGLECGPGFHGIRWTRPRTACPPDPVNRIATSANGFSRTSFPQFGHIPPPLAQRRPPGVSEHQVMANVCHPTPPSPTTSLAPGLCFFRSNAHNAGC
jgi:hypothetical protein